MLAAFFFLMVVEGFSGIFEMVVELGLFSGFKVRTSNLVVFQI